MYVYKNLKNKNIVFPNFNCPNMAQEALNNVNSER